MAENHSKDYQERIFQALSRLYPGKELKIGQEILDLVSVGRKSSKLPPLGEFTSGTGILITYPDMLFGEGATALEHLDRFSQKWLAGHFSHMHILPFFPSSGDEGFSVMDYEAVDPRFGTWDQIDHIAQSQSLVCDLILNHASSQGTWFQGFLQGKADYDNFFVTRPGDHDGTQVFRPRAHPLLTPFRTQDGREIFVWTTFSADQVDLNFHNPRVLLAMVKILLDYAGHGAKIIRLDALAFAWKVDGTNCLDRPEVHLIVKILRAALEAGAPGVYLLSETNLPQAINDSYFGQDDEAQMVYRFPLPPLALHGFISGRAEGISRWIASLEPPNPKRFHVNFLSSHDGIGVTPARGLLSPQEIHHLVETVKARGGVVSYRGTPEGLVPYELNTTFFNALSASTSPREERIRVFLSCHALMVALAGIPAFWFHSLVGSQNWDEGPGLTGSNRSIHRERLNREVLESELEDKESLRNSVYQGLTHLMDARSARSAFHPSSPQYVLSPNGNGGIFGPRETRELPSGPLVAILRGDEAGAVLTLVNLSDSPVSCTLPPAFIPQGAAFDPTGFSDVAGKPFLIQENSGVLVPAQGVVWLDGTFKGEFSCI